MKTFSGICRMCNMLFWPFWMLRYCRETYARGRQFSSVRRAKCILMMFNCTFPHQVGWLTWVAIFKCIICTNSAHRAVRCILFGEYMRRCTFVWCYDLSKMTFMCQFSGHSWIYLINHAFNIHIKCRGPTNAHDCWLSFEIDIWTVFLRWFFHTFQVYVSFLYVLNPSLFIKDESGGWQCH